MTMIIREAAMTRTAIAIAVVMKATVAVAKVSFRCFTPIETCAVISAVLAVLLLLLTQPIAEWRGGQPS